MNSEPQIREIAASFDVRGELTTVELLGGGHINDSYRLTFTSGGESKRYLLQRINDAVFPEPLHVMENIQRVTAHISERLRIAGTPDAARRTLTLVPVRDSGRHEESARDGCRAGPIPRAWIGDAQRGCWRLYHFIEGTISREVPETPAQVEQAARVYGEFQRLLADLPPPRLHETIPDFHNTPLRCTALDRAVAADACRRAARARPEIDFSRRFRTQAGALLDLFHSGQIPERVVHNDTKLSNVLLDERTGRGMCVVDLDIVMPGLSLFDFGDMVRSMTCVAAEDERDLARVEVQVPLFEAVARGYLSAMGSVLTTVEQRFLVCAGRLITLEQGVRFLTDYLNGDTYYKTIRPEQNLDRCRAQFRLVESIARLQPELERAIARL